MEAPEVKLYPTDALSIDGNSTVTSAFEDLSTVAGTKPGAGVLRGPIQALPTEHQAAAFPQREFDPGRSAMPVAGKVFDSNDFQQAVEASSSFWHSTARIAKKCERRIASFIGVRDVRLVHYGSSAKLVALSALASSYIGRPCTANWRRSYHGDRADRIAMCFAQISAYEAASQP